MLLFPLATFGTAPSNVVGRDYYFFISLSPRTRESARAQHLTKHTHARVKVGDVTIKHSFVRAPTRLPIGDLRDTTATLAETTLGS